MPALITRVTPFARFWLCRVCTSLAFQMAGVAIGWLVYARTGSAYYLGLVGLCQFVPMVILTFVVGHLADRVDRRLIVATCEGINAVILGTVAFGAMEGWLTVPALFAAVTVLGAARAFEHPTLSSLLPSIVPAAELSRAVALSSSAMLTATIAGPSLGGLLYAVAPSVPLAGAAIFGVGALLAILSVPAPRRAAAAEPATLRSVFAGLRFIFDRPVVLGAISLDLFAVLLGGVTALLPIFAAEILHVGPLGLGLLRAAPAVGALGVSLFVGRVGLNVQVGPRMFAAVIVFGVATVVFSLSRNIPLSFACLAVLGMADTISVVTRTALVQLSTPDSMRGRVNAVNSLFIGTSNQLGEFESGIVAGLFGTVPSGVIGGVGTIGVALLWMWLFPALRRMNAMPSPAVEPTRMEPEEIEPPIANANLL